VHAMYAGESDSPIAFHPRQRELSIGGARRKFGAGFSQARGGVACWENRRPKEGVGYSDG
jgi:hypothetical protein